MVVNSDFFFLSHRIPIALEAERRGWNVTVITPDTGRASEIRDAGLTYLSFPLSRSGTGVGELRALRFLRQTYRTLQPDIVHHVTPKPVIYGSMAALGIVPVVVNAVSGLGYSFINKGLHPLRITVETLYRLALKGRTRWAIFQNEDDRRLFVQRGMVKRRRTVLIRGSGVDVATYKPSPETGGVPIVLMPARLLWDKGVGEFVDAARIVRRAGVSARFVLAGKLDAGNPSAVAKQALEEWVSDGLIEWWGDRTDMPDVYKQARVVVLPSYREGLPKALLEAGASARAIVTTDVPGCRDVVDDGVNGLLVPPRDASQLGVAIRTLLNDHDLRSRLRVAARENVVRHHSIEQVVAAHFKVYERALSSVAAEFAPTLDGP